MAAQMSTGLDAVKVATIQVGTTGTIGSLMTWELESMKHDVVKTAPPVPSPRLKRQSPPVSVPCGATPRRLQPQPRKNLQNEASSSSRCRPSGVGGANIGSSSRSSNSSSSSCGGGSSADGVAVQKVISDDVLPLPKGGRQTPRNKKGERIPVLSAVGMEKGTTKVKERSEKKERLSFLVEVVDLKCNNPMSSRLKKLGFSKLSETIA